MKHAGSTRSETRPRWIALLIRFGGAFLSCAVALAIWFLWPVMHQDPFTIFIAAVIVAARFFGFGAALLCTAASACTLWYFVIDPRLKFTVSSTDLERLSVFMLISVLTAGLARQRSRAEARAVEARETMAAIVESSVDAILSTTPTGIITSWNRGAETLYGYTAEEALGQHIMLLAPPERAREVEENRAALNRGEPVASYETERWRKDGTRVPLLLSISPLHDRTGRVIGSSAIARDITEQKRAVEALRRNERLATAGRLAATIAHEINNPLEAIVNLLYLAQQDPERRNDYLQSAEKEVQRLAVIAKQTLGLVRDGSSSPATVRVADAVDEVLRLYSHKLQDKELQLESDCDHTATIQGYEGEVRQLVSNLIINAIEASDQNGRLRLRVAHSHEWRNGFRRGVRITVADTGTGIGQRDRAQIFDPFYSTKKGMGTGLGLWLCHNIVEQHGGTIRVRSCVQPGRSGTVFTVFLPELRDAPKAA
jgi:PAS domain S-box-containing protein